MCAGGSISSDCDEVTGTCRCNEGVGEDDCSACLDGFFNFTSSGCTGTCCLCHDHVCVKLGTYHSEAYSHRSVTELVGLYLAHPLRIIKAG